MTLTMGTVRADGFIFRCYQKKRLKSGETRLREQWLSPESMENYRAMNQRAQKAWRERKGKS